MEKRGLLGSIGNQPCPSALLGTAKSAIRAILGNPESTIATVEFHPADHVAFWYDQNNTVTGVAVHWGPNGTRYDGRILGVAIGEPLAKCLRIWGQPYGTLEMPFEYRIVRFRVGSLLVEADVWNKSGRDPNLGAYTGDTLKGVELYRDPEAEPKGSLPSEIGTQRFVDQLPKPATRLG